MDATRRTAIRSIAAAGGLAAVSTKVFATGEYDDDERSTDEHDDERPKDKTAEPPEGAIRVGHFSPDAPDVDVYVDGDRVIEGLAYHEVTPYLEVPPGTYTVTITAAGDPETVAFEGDLWIGRAFYTIAAIGELGEGTFRPHVLVDAGAALVRVGHFSPNAPPVDVYANDGANPIVSELAFGRSTNYVALPAADYTFDVRPAGDPETTVFSFDASLTAGDAVSAFAIGYLEPPAGTESREFDVRLTVDGPTADG